MVLVNKDGVIFRPIESGKVMRTRELDEILLGVK